LSPLPEEVVHQKGGAVLQGRKRPAEFKSAAGSQAFVAAHQRVKK
jgi:hypothetical protein